MLGDYTYIYKYVYIDVPSTDPEYGYRVEKDLPFCDETKKTLPYPPQLLGKIQSPYNNYGSGKEKSTKSKNTGKKRRLVRYDLVGSDQDRPNNYRWNKVVFPHWK